MLLRRGRRSDKGHLRRLAARRQLELYDRKTLRRFYARTLPSVRAPRPDSLSRQAQDSPSDEHMNVLTLCVETEEIPPTTLKVGSTHDELIDREMVEYRFTISSFENQLLKFLHLPRARLMIVLRPPPTVEEDEDGVSPREPSPRPASSRTPPSSPRTSTSNASPRSSLQGQSSELPSPRAVPDSTEGGSTSSQPLRARRKSSAVGKRSTETQGARNDVPSLHISPPNLVLSSTTSDREEIIIDAGPLSPDTRQATWPASKGITWYLRPLRYHLTDDVSADIELQISEDSPKADVFLDPEDYVLVMVDTEFERYTNIGREFYVSLSELFHPIPVLPTRILTKPISVKHSGYIYRFVADSTSTVVISKAMVPFTVFWDSNSSFPTSQTNSGCAIDVKRTSIPVPDNEQLSITVVLSPITNVSIVESLRSGRPVFRVRSVSSDKDTGSSDDDAPLVANEDDDGESARSFQRFLAQSAPAAGFFKSLADEDESSSGSGGTTRKVESIDLAKLKQVPKANPFSSGLGDEIGGIGIGMNKAAGHFNKSEDSEDEDSEHQRLAPIWASADNFILSLYNLIPSKIAGKL